MQKGSAGLGRPFREQTGGLAGGLPSVSDTHTHTERDYCQLGYSHNVIFVFRKLELSPECERQRGSVRSAAAAVHQAMKLLPGPGKPETKNTTAHSDQTERDTIPPLPTSGALGLRGAQEAGGAPGQSRSSAVREPSCLLQRRPTARPALPGVPGSSWWERSLLTGLTRGQSRAASVPHAVSEDVMSKEQTTVSSAFAFPAFSS